MAQKLDDLHLADLHELAAELGVPRFRLLRRAELVSEIEARRGPGDPSVAEPEPEPVPDRESELEPEPDRKQELEPEAERKGPKPERERERLEEAATEEVTGVLEI